MVIHIWVILAAHIKSSRNFGTDAKVKVGRLTKKQTSFLLAQRCLAAPVLKPDISPQSKRMKVYVFRFKHHGTKHAYTPCIDPMSTGIRPA